MAPLYESDSRNVLMKSPWSYSGVMYWDKLTSHPSLAHWGVSKLLIITTSNSPPPIAVDAVILARAWFSDSEMKRSLMPGFEASKCFDSLIASVICELDTIAMVTVWPDAPKDPKPAPPARVEHATTATTTSVPRRRRNIANLISYY